MIGTDGSVEVVIGSTEVGRLPVPSTNSDQLKGHIAVVESDKKTNELSGEIQLTMHEENTTNFLKIVEAWQKQMRTESAKYVYAVFEDKYGSVYPAYPLLRNGPEHMWLQRCVLSKGKLPRGKFFKKVKKLYGYTNSMPDIKVTSKENTDAVPTNETKQETEVD